MTDHRILIDAQSLATEMAGGRLTILAVRSDDSVAPRPYTEHPRIRGAIETDLATDFAAPSNPRDGTRPLPPIERLESRVRSWGIDQDTPVVVYDHDGGLQAARAWWVLRWAGLPDVRLLDGGFPAWQRAGLETTCDPTAEPVALGTARLSVGHLPVLDADQSAALARTGILLDSRITANYEGGPTAPGAPRRGHIPGAVNVPAPATLTAEGCFADPHRLQALYAQAGIDGRKTVGVYCGAGVSAAHAVIALALLGIDSALYPGSWSAWISDPRRPVATGPRPQ